jgi:small-conductance mechanosensitive channel
MADISSFIGDVPPRDFLLFIILFLLTIFVSNIISEILRRLLKYKIKGSKYKVVAKTVQYILIFSVTYYGFSNILGFDFTAFLTAFGVIGVAVAFSAQQTIQNLIAGLFIIGGGIIKLDDWVEVPGFPSTELSQVKEIGLMRTTLREFNGRLIELPNSIFVTSKIIKYPDGDFFKVSFEIKIDPKSDFENVKKIITDICNKNEKILPNIPRKEKRGLQALLKSLPDEHLGLLSFLQRKINYEKFEPRLYLKEIGKNSLTLVVMIWIWEIRNKDKIISNLMEEILVQFPKKKIKLV